MGRLNVQVAALPVRKAEDGRLRVLLVTSRETKRWVIPKGWPMKGKTARKAAAQEALEEAGVLGSIARKPLGSYQYWKRRDEHFDLCEVEVYLLDVERQKPTWRERNQRRAEWFDAALAAKLVDEPGLAQLIAALSPAPRA